MPEPLSSEQIPAKLYAVTLGDQEWPSLHVGLVNPRGREELGRLDSFLPISSVLGEGEVQVRLRLAPHKCGGREGRAHCVHCLVLFLSIVASTLGKSREKVARSHLALGQDLAVAGDMSSPNPSTPRRSSRRSRGSTPGTPVGGAPSASGTDAGGGEPSSELARPLPQSSPQMPPPSDAAMAPNSVPQRDRSSVGPGSVLVSEIDLSSPLNYGTPSSVDSRARGSQQQLHGLGVGSNVIGTPIRVRSDIQSEKRLRQVNVTPGGVPYDPVSERGVSSEAGGTPRANRNPPSEVVPPSEHSDTAPHLVIWGTDVSVHTCKQKFRKFLTTFVDPDLADDERMEGFRADEPLYMQRLEEVRV